MAITVKHSKVSTIPDADDTSLVRPSDWNADHTLDGTVPVANGGTGAATLTGYVKGNGTSTMTASATIPSTDVTGLGTMSTQNSNNINVTGGSMSGVTISDYIATTQKGVANGVASLDGSGTVPISQLPAAVIGALSYQGTWNASTNSPTLTSSVGTKGYYYVVNVAGSTNLNGITDWQIGDWAVYNGTAWQKIDNTDAVTSVNGYTGTVVLTAADVGAVPYTGATAAVDLNNKSLVNVSHLGVNTTTVPDILIRAIGDNNTSSRIAMRGYSSDANSSSMRVTKFRGTTSAPQAPQSGDSLGKFELAGYGTTSSGGYAQASLEGVATEAWGATARGAKALIKVTPNTTTTQVTALTIDQNSAATFASTVTANGVLLTGNTGTVTSVAATAGTGISISGSPITTSGTLTVTNTAPDQTVVLTAGTGISTSGTYPNFTITNTSPSSGGTVTSVSGTTGRITSTGGATPVIDLASGVATAGTTGSATLIPVVTIDTYGRVTSITTAANPQGTVTSVTGTSPVVSSGGATPAISMPAATTSVNGYLTSTDWNTFNSKGSGTVTSVSATAPITSSGGATPNLAMPAATGSVNGYLTSTDWTTFNNKGSGTVTSVAALTLGTTGTDLSSTVATGTTTPVITLQVPTASATNRGALSSTDWSTFNSKLTTVTADAPLSGSGTSGSHLVIATANTTTTGAISSTDWNTFNGKQAALVSGTNIKTVSGTSLLGSGDLGLIGATYGGTGVNNGSNTITIAGNLTHAGAFTQSFTATANTAVTLPAGATAASNNLLSSATAVGIVTGTPSSTTYLRGDGTWSSISAGLATYTRTSFTATAGQTTFSATYVVGYVEVFQNGVLLNATDYTASNGTSVVLALGASVNDIIETVAYNTTTATTAAGSANQVQYNSSGNFAGSSNLTFDGTTLNANALSLTTALPLASGGTGKASAPAAMSALMGFTTTATAAGTTVLTNTSSYYQFFTGTSTQTITLPVTSTLATGWTFHICNNSTGLITVNSSGSNLVSTVIPGTTVMFTCIGTALTTAADWESGFTDFSTLLGNDGTVPAMAQFYLSSVGSALSGATQNYFGANSAVSLDATSTYEIEAYCYFLKTTSGTVTWIPTFSTSATVAHAILDYTPVTGFTTSNISGAMVTAEATQQTVGAMTFAATAALTTAVYHVHKFKIRVTTNTACNFRLNATISAGSITPQVGSWYTARKIAINSGTFVA